MLFELRSRRGSSLAHSALCLRGAVPWGSVTGTFAFQLPPDQAPTVSLLPFQCLNNQLPFSVYYLQRDRSWPPPHTGVIPQESLESFPVSRQQPPLALQLGVLA